MAIKIVTGLNGAGKTSNELWDFLKSPKYEGRPKFATPVKDFDGPAHGVQPLEDLTSWQSLPEGSVVFVDEVQRYLPPRSSKAAPPDWIEKLAEHRHMGLDFIMTTPNAMMIDPYVRRLGNPHVHYVRPWNMSRSTRWTFEGVQNDPLSGTAKKTGQSEIVKANPEVFTIYTSTVLDTHTSRFPKRKLYTLLGALAFVGFGAWYTVHSLAHMGKKPEPLPVIPSRFAQPAPMVGSGGSFRIGTDDRERAHWDAAGITPRVKGMPWTAPIYDNLTQPVDFPRIAACVESKTHPCQCYTQQATPLDIDLKTCSDIVAHGAFDPWYAGPEQMSEQDGQVHLAQGDGRQGDGRQGQLQPVAGSADARVADADPPHRASATDAMDQGDVPSVVNAGDGPGLPSDVVPQPTKHPPLITTVDPRSR